MDLMGFKKSILEETRFRAAADKVSEKEAFLSLYTNVLMEAEEIVDFTLLPFEGIGKNRRKIQIDGYDFDELDNVLSVFICPDLENGTDTLILTEAERLFARAKSFIEDVDYVLSSAEESAPGYGLAIDIKLRYKDVSRYKFYLLTDMSMSRALREIKSDVLCGKPVEYSVWDIDRWYQLSNSQTGKEDIVIDLKVMGSVGIPCLPASKSEEYTAYLCNIPGKILADLYLKFGGRLLEGNVRSFLTAKGKINKEIRNTILNRPDMFFAFNNGIAATAYNIKIESIDNVDHIIQITALQIVNGGQTTASLAMALLNDKERSNNLQNIYVPMKLSLVSPEKAQELIPQISRYANSQNKVSDADFFSNSQFHVRIEELSRRYTAPAVDGNQYGTFWYYERARGQFNQELSKRSEAQKKDFLLRNPKHQLFTKTDLAKYFNLYLRKPHTVSLGAQKNFLDFGNWAEEQWRKDNAVFNEGFFHRIVALNILFKATDNIVKQQPWYESGYKANIVYYTIGKLFDILKNQYPDKAFPFQSIWLRQKITHACEEQLVLLSKVMFELLTDENRDVQNVTEWAKRAVCWDKARNINLQLLPIFLRELTDRTIVAAEQREERHEQAALNRVSAIIDVTNYGSENWRYLIEWGRENRVLSPEEISFIQAAINIDIGRIPSERQSARILRILEKARLESFPK